MARHFQLQSQLAFLTVLWLAVLAWTWRYSLVRLSCIPGCFRFPRPLPVEPPGKLVTRQNMTGIKSPYRASSEAHIPCHSSCDPLPQLLACRDPAGTGWCAGRSRWEPRKVRKGRPVGFRMPELPAEQVLETQRPRRRLGIAMAGAAVSVAAFALTPTVGAASTPRVQAGPLNGTIGLALGGGRVHGYRISLAGDVGSPNSYENILSLTLKKTNGRIDQEHSWSVAITPSEVTIDRQKGTISVNHPIGPNGSDGLLSFQFSGHRGRAIRSCGATHAVVVGRAIGTIRLKIGDHFFRTVSLKRMSGRAIGTYSAGVCRGCPPPYKLVLGAGPYSPTTPQVTLEAQTVAGSIGSALAVSVFEPTLNSPFVGVGHTLATIGRRTFLTVNRALTRATLSTPGGPLSGHLLFKGVGSLRKESGNTCNLASRTARVVKGKITARFDSIGAVTLGKNLNRSPSGLTALGSVR